MQKGAKIKLKGVKTNAKRDENTVECVRSKFLVVTEGGKNMYHLCRAGFWVNIQFPGNHRILKLKYSKPHSYKKSYLI
jgi:hypothetical protein